MRFTGPSAGGPQTWGSGRRSLSHLGAVRDIFRWRDQDNFVTLAGRQDHALRLDPSYGRRLQIRYHDYPAPDQILRLVMLRDPGRGGHLALADVDSELENLRSTGHSFGREDGANP